jgi:hypothetical protein
MDPSEYVNPKRTLKRREEEAGAGTAADSADPTIIKSTGTPQEGKKPAVRFGNGRPQDAMTAEQKEVQRRRFLELQRRQRVKVL